MNYSESKIKNMLEAKGYTVLHVGAPDFLCYKFNNKKRVPENIMFVEVKSSTGKLSDEQLQWALALESISATIEIVNSDSVNDIEYLLKKAI